MASMVPSTENTSARKDDSYFQGVFIVIGEKKHKKDVAKMGEGRTALTGARVRR